MEHSEEWQAVEEIIQLEKRHIEILQELRQKEELFSVALALRLNVSRLGQQIEELESELSDIEKALRS